MIYGLFSFSHATISQDAIRCKKAKKREYTARVDRRSPVPWKAEEIFMNASKDNEQARGDNDVIGNTSKEPTNCPHRPKSHCRNRLVDFGRLSFRWWTSLRFPDPLHQLLTDIHKQMGRSWGWGLGVLSGERVTEKVPVNGRFSFGWIWLANFLPKRAGTDPDGQDPITSWWKGKMGGNQPQWQDMTHCEQKQVNALIYDISYGRDRNLENSAVFTVCFMQ